MCGNNVASRIVDHDMFLADERDKVTVIDITLRKKIYEAEVTQWLHHHTVSFEVIRLTIVQQTKEVILFSLCLTYFLLFD